MATVPEIQVKVDKTVVNMDRFNLFVNGLANQTVTTDNGTVKTLTGIVADLNVSIGSAADSAELAHQWAQKPTGDVDPTGHPGEKSAYYWANNASLTAGQVATTLAAIPASVFKLTSASAGGLTALIDGKIVATPKRMVAADNYGLQSSDTTFAFGQSQVTASWSAAHRGLPAVLSGEPSFLYEVELPAGYRTLGSASTITIAIMRPAAPLPLTAGTFPLLSLVQNVATWDLSAFPSQVLPALRWSGDPVQFQAGDLLVAWSKQVEHIATNVPASPATFFFDFSPADRPDPSNPLVPDVQPGVQTTGVKPFAYKAKIAAGQVRSGLGGPSSMAVIGSDGKIAGGGFEELVANVGGVASDVVSLQTAVAALGGNTGPKGDAVVSALPAGSAFTAGDNKVTVADAVFTSADIGKTVYCSQAGNGVTSPILPVGTITNILSSTRVQVSTSWTVSYSAGTQYELVWGTDDTAALESLGVQAKKTGKFVLPDGHFIMRRCPIDWRGVDKPLSIRGAGRWNSVIHIAPNYDFSTTLTNGYSCLLFKADVYNYPYGTTVSGFGLAGPLMYFTGKAAYIGLTGNWSEEVLSDIYVSQLAGLKSGITTNAKVSFINVRSKQHLGGGSTHGITALNGFNAYHVHTGNCSGAGFYAYNIDWVTNINQEPLGFVDSLFDECDIAGVLVENCKELRLSGCSAFGSPNQATPGLELRGSSIVNLQGTAVSGYGTGTPRNSCKVGAGGLLRLTAGSRIVLGGDGTAGYSLNNAGTVIVDGTSRVTGPVVGTAPIRQFPGTSLPPTLSTGASNADIVAEVNAIRALLVSTGAAT